MDGSQLHCISTTIDQYGHLEFASKLYSAQIISRELKYPTSGGHKNEEYLQSHR